MPAGTRSQKRRTTNRPPATGNRGGRGGAGGQAPHRDPTPPGPSALEVAQRLERERLAEVARLERERLAEEARLEVVRRQQEEGARILADIQREEEEEARARRRQAMRGRTTPAPPAPKEPEQGPADRSSPIASTRHEEEAVLEQFFEWHIVSSQGERSRQRWRRVQDIVLDQAWTIDDLKGMSDPSSRLYQIAIDRGVPDGVVRNLKADLKVFKPRWREAKELLDRYKGW